MKVKELVNSMVFSHRPADGISVGVKVNAGTAYMAVVFLRDGDSFNRKLARHILAQRILSTVDDNSKVRYVHVIENIPDQVDDRHIIRELRKLFKPNPTCNDSTFMTTTSFNGEGDGFCNGPLIREPMARDRQWQKIVTMFQEAVKTVKA